MTVQEKHYRVLLGFLCPVLMLFGTAMSAPRPIERPLMQAESTSLAVTPSVTGRPGEAVSIEVTLSTASGAPMVEREVVLRSTFGLALNARTDALGSATFLLPPDMPEGDHTLRLVFAGGDGYAPAIAVTTLYYHAASPGSVAAAGQDGAGFDAGDAMRPVTDVTAPAHATRVLAQPDVHTRPGEMAVVGAQLTTLDGEAVVGAELILVADGLPELRSTTAANGIAAFQLPDDLPAGDYQLRIVFPGAGDRRSSLALVLLHHDAEPSGHSSTHRAPPAVATPPPVPALPGPVSAAPHGSGGAHRRPLVQVLAHELQCAPLRPLWPQSDATA